MNIFKPEQKYVDLVNQWKRIDNFIINNQTLFCNTISTPLIRCERLRPEILITGAVDFAIWYKKSDGNESLPVLISKDMNYCSSYLEYTKTGMISMGYAPTKSDIKFENFNQDTITYEISTIMNFNLESKTEEEMFQLNTLYSEKELTDLWLMNKIITDFDKDYFHSFCGDPAELDPIDEEFLKLAISYGVPYA